MPMSDSRAELERPMRQQGAQRKAPFDTKRPAQALAARLFAKPASDKIIKCWRASAPDHPISVRW